MASFCSDAVGSGVASILAPQIVHKTVGIAQCLGRDFTLFRLLSQPFAQLIKLILRRGETLSFEHGVPIRWNRGIPSSMTVIRSEAYRKGISAITLAETGAVPARMAALPRLGFMRSDTAALRASPFSTSRASGFSRSRR